MTLSAGRLLATASSRETTLSLLFCAWREGNGASGEERTLEGLRLPLNPSTTLSYREWLDSHVTQGSSALSPLSQLGELGRQQQNTKKDDEKNQRVNETHFSQNTKNQS